ncbi:MAG TPA: FtsQ-type POTRA domain-containing protein [Vicinamibacteria bacterium]|nr:FtsQ-type POTRA domain-containing protein [Vicinamibacteria bacterium]
MKRGLPEPRKRVRLTPPAELPFLPEDEPPFLRPSKRTRIRRTKRGGLARAILVLEVLGAALVGLLGLWTVYSRAMASERLKVERLEVRGSHFLSEGEVRELLGPAVGENLLGLNIEELKQRLRASSWVADATVSRSLPDTLRVEIRERVPVALAEADRLYLMDGEGVLIDLFGPRTAGFDLPIVRGLGGGGDADGRRDRAQRAGALLEDLGELGAEVSEVEVEPSGDLRLVLRGAGEVLRMGTPPYRSRFLTFLGLRKDLAERCPDAEYFDLRFRDQIIAKRPIAPAAKPATNTEAPVGPSGPLGSPPLPKAPGPPAPLALLLPAGEERGR